MLYWYEVRSPLHFSYKPHVSEYPELSFVINEADTIITYFVYIFLPSRSRLWIFHEMEFLLISCQYFAWICFFTSADRRAHNQIHLILIGNGIQLYLKSSLSGELTVIPITMWCLQEFGTDWQRVNEQGKCLIWRDSISRKRKEVDCKEWH
jgi:hypothetical protein